MSLIPDPEVMSEDHVTIQVSVTVPFDDSHTAITKRYSRSEWESFRPILKQAIIERAATEVAEYVIRNEEEQR